MGLPHTLDYCRVHDGGDIEWELLKNHVKQHHVIMLSNNMSLEYNSIIVEDCMILYFIKRLTKTYSFLRYSTFK